MSTLAFVGLGRMGKPMLTHIISSFATKYEIRAFDVDRQRTRYFESSGIRLCESLQEAVSEANFLFMSVPDSNGLCP